MLSGTILNDARDGKICWVDLVSFVSLFESVQFCCFKKRLIAVITLNIGTDRPEQTV